jgi:hypothetical protein
MSRGRDLWARARELKDRLVQAKKRDDEVLRRTMEGETRAAPELQARGWYLEPEGWAYEVIRLLRVGCLLYGYVFYPYEYRKVTAVWPSIHISWTRTGSWCST